MVNGAILPLSYLAKNQLVQALDAGRRYAEVTAQSPLSQAVLARVEMASGNAARAQELLDELEEKARDYYVSGTALALANLACGRETEAIAHLERACRERDWWGRRWLVSMPLGMTCRSTPASAACCERWPN